ncbi:MAG: type II secretion system GspH family protein [Planctomycetaceae bacterium]|nr:type II secretion system GspH family protein [Planctomycetaceae bacterium]
MINEKRFRLPGFTLVELLVVISIIAMLLAVLMPALGKAKASAVRVVCASNMKQTGLCMSMYISDNEYFPTDYMPPRATDAGDLTQDYWQQKLIKYAKNGKVLSDPYFEKMVSSGKTSVENITMEKLYGATNEKVNWYYWFCSGYAQSFGYNHRAFGCGGYASSGFRCYSRTGMGAADIKKPVLKVKQSSVRNPAGLFLALTNVSSFANSPYVGDYKERYHPKDFRHSGGVVILYADGHSGWKKIDSKEFELDSNGNPDSCWGDINQIR